MNFTALVIPPPIASYFDMKLLFDSAADFTKFLLFFRMFLLGTSYED